jgi:hypothetical protein
LLNNINQQLKQNIRKLAQKNYYSARFYYHLRLKREISRQDQLILVYQMGKVGSSSVVRSLKTQNFLTFNVHTFNPYYLKKDEQLYKKEFIAGSINAKTLWDELLFRKQLGRRFNGKPIKIITLVRDPVARNISLFFQWPNMIMEHTADKYHLRSPSFDYEKVFSTDGIEDKMAQLFMTQFKLHERPLIWLDKELKHHFGIDAYCYDFPKEKGYSTYREGNIEAMLIKLEKLSEVAGEAFSKFLGIESFQLIPANIGRKKNTSDLYERFLNSIKLPSDYLETMYNSRFVKHFYSRKEIEGFRARWSRSS